MMDATKYAPGYYPVPAGYDSWVKKDHIEKAPAWCSVDLRDGNQALIVPMSLAEKLEFFQMLVKIGFKEIEVGFPAASETEYEFLRTLIEKNMIPADVTVQVLTQCRDHIIRRTFEAVKGAPRAVIHFYNSTSVAQREQVFHKSKEEIKQIAVDGAKLVKQLSEEYEGNFLFEYSPESFTGTEVDYAVEVCNAVLDIMQPTPERPMIINLPVTVEMSMPHVYANQIEYCDKHLKYRDSVIISTHPHNDRGTGVACAELAVLAGAQRVECCLFGNGERTGNVCLVTLAMNLYSQGIDPELRFEQMNRVVEVVENCNQIPVHPRHPWAGSLAYTAFSGSHQDAIKKGFDARQPGDPWQMPYLPIDPQDIGCSYEAVIRVNSQSGKSGSAWLIEQNHGLKLPRGLQQDFSQHVQQATDSDGKEMTHHALWQLFRTRYGLQAQPALTLLDYQSASQQDGQLSLQATLRHHGETRRLQGQGNGLLSAAASGLSALFRQPFMIKDYHEHTLGARSDSRSVAYIRCVFPQGESYWGVGIDNDVARASLQALCNALSAADQAGGRK